MEIFLLMLLVLVAIILLVKIIRVVYFVIKYGNKETYRIKKTYSPTYTDKVIYIVEKLIDTTAPYETLSWSYKEHFDTIEEAREYIEKRKRWTEIYMKSSEIIEII